MMKPANLDIPIVRGDYVRLEIVFLDGNGEPYALPHADYTMEVVNRYAPYDLRTFKGTRSGSMLTFAVGNGIKYNANFSIVATRDTERVTVAYGKVNVKS